MNHEMKLYPSWFYGIKEGKQTLEVRLYDEKRKKINIWDTITFTLLPELNESISTKVTWLLIYPSFKELFSNISPEYWNASWWSIEECVACAQKIYTEQDEKELGVLWIRIELL